MLAPHVKVKKGSKYNSTGKKYEKEKVYFCKQYKTGQCAKTAPHLVLVRGKTNNVQHVCATCLLKAKESRSHREMDAVQSMTKHRKFQKGRLHNRYACFRIRK